MSSLRSVAVAGGGLMAVLVLLMLGAAGIQLVRGAEDRPSVPLWEQAGWDGTQFVINDPAGVKLGSHWTSPDGIEWTQRNDLSMAGPLYSCHPDFRCDVIPEQPEPVPFHFARANTFTVAGRDGVVLLEVSMNYSSVRDDPRDPSRIEIHPALLDRAARESECFAAVDSDDPGRPSGSSTASIVGFGEGFETADWIFEATCQDQDGTDRFAINLTDVLTDHQMELLTEGPAPQLFISRSDGSVERVTNPPTSTYWIDGIEGREAVTSLSGIAATSSHFWSSDNGTLVLSADGLSWESADFDARGREVGAVVANLGGDVAVLLVDDARLDSRGDKEVVVSHDGGATWSAPVVVAGDGEQALLASVGPAGVSLTISGPQPTDTNIFVDDDRAEIVFTLTQAFWSSHLTVGHDTILSGRELVAPDGEGLGPVLDVYDTNGNLMVTVEP